jgi:hypothetical protein
MNRDVAETVTEDSSTRSARTRIEIFRVGARQPWHGLIPNPVLWVKNGSQTRKMFGMHLPGHFPRGTPTLVGDVRFFGKAPHGEFPEPEFPFSVFARRVMYTRGPLNSSSS